MPKIMNNCFEDGGILSNRGKIVEFGLLRKFVIKRLLMLLI
jgi:hypothetical protein